MFWLKNIAILSLMFQKLCQSQEWKAINPSYILQNYKQIHDHQFQNKKELLVVPTKFPPLFMTNLKYRTPTIQPHLKAVQQVTTSEQIESVDFRNLKTQNLYKTTLSKNHSPFYEFQYKVHDPKENNYQEKYETRVGDSVKGHYSVREPNGYLRHVKYVSDEDGFRALVFYHHTDRNEGKSYVQTSVQSPI